jgi:cytidylate kinase
MIVTIDGPAGAGKSSAARALAARLGFEFLDTGAMYRAVALAMLQAGHSPSDESQVGPLLSSLQLEMPPGRVVLNGEDVSERIRSAEVTAASSVVAVLGAVRAYLARQQRIIASDRNMVCEGRDQGTVVFPDAGCKFFLVANPEARARRRQAELEARGLRIELAELLRDQNVRDERDAGRAVGPLRPAEDAILIDSTELSLDQVVERMETEVRQRSGCRGNRADGA